MRDIVERDSYIIVIISFLIEHIYLYKKIGGNLSRILPICTAAIHANIHRWTLQVRIE